MTDEEMEKLMRAADSPAARELYKRIAGVTKGPNSLATVMGAAALLVRSIEIEADKGGDYSGGIMPIITAMVARIRPNWS